MICNLGDRFLILLYFIESQLIIILKSITDSCVYFIKFELTYVQRATARNERKIST